MTSKTISAQPINSKIDGIDFINANDMDLLIVFFNKILTSPDNFGENFYNQLVKNNPELKLIFENVHRTNLGYVFLHSIISILNAVNNKQDWRTMIYNLAQKHKKFDIKDEHYALIRKVFRNTIRQYANKYPNKSPISLTMIESFFDEFITEFKNGFNK